MVSATFLWTESGPDNHLLWIISESGINAVDIAFSVGGRWFDIPMSISDLDPGATPAAVLADAVAGVRGLAETLWSARSDDELVEVVALVQQLAAAAAVVEAGAVVEADARDLAKQQLHHGSTGDWLTHLGGLRHGEGKRRVRRAHAAYDAEIIPTILGSRGEVLDVGRLRRLVTPALWTALMVRDRHCTFPACTRPPLMCHAHHLHHWADGGDTSLDNLALLCGHHHRVIHHTPWEMRLNPDDRQPEFLPPQRLGIPPGWIDIGHARNSGGVRSAGRARRRRWRR